MQLDSIRRAPRMGGFTIIEMVIVIGIVSILLLIAIPNFQKWIANSKVRSTAEALQNDLRLAQATAMTQGRQTILVFTNVSPPAVNATPATAGGNALYWYVQRTPNTLDVAQGGNAAIPILIDTSPLGLTTGVTIQSTAILTQAQNGGQVPQPVNAVCFNSLGRQVAASTGNGDSVPAGATCVPESVQFTLTPPTGGDRKLAVQVSSGGTVRSCDPNFTQTQQPFGC